MREITLRSRLIVGALLLASLLLPSSGCDHISFRVPGVLDMRAAEDPRTPTTKADDIRIDEHNCWLFPFLEYDQRAARVGAVHAMKGARLRAIDLEERNSNCVDFSLVATRVKQGEAPR